MPAHIVHVLMVNRIKMYKNKITQWGLDKKNKEHEVLAFIRKTTQRAAVGKKTIARVRNHVLDLEEVQRYIKRKPYSMEFALEQSASTPPGLVCFTPEMPSSPRIPEVYAVPEQIFVLMRDYVTGSFESGTWICDDPKSGCRSIKNFGGAATALENFNAFVGGAYVHYEKGSVAEGGRLLVAAAAGIKDILVAESPTFFLILISLMSYTRLKKTHIFLPILRQLSDMAAIVLPEKHPIGQIYRHLGSLDSHQLDDIVPLSFQSFLDQFESILGQFNFDALNLRTKYIAYHTGNFEQIESGLRDHLQKCISAHEGSDDASLDVLSLIVNNLLNQERYVEAEHTALDLIARAPYTDMFDSRYFYCEGYQFLSLAQCELGKIPVAEASIDRAIQESALARGWDHPRTLKYLLTYETMLEGWGNHASAAKVRRQKQDIIESLDFIV